MALRVRQLRLVVDVFLPLRTILGRFSVMQVPDSRLLNHSIYIIITASKHQSH